jgi:hypothetical protein
MKLVEKAFISEIWKDQNSPAQCGAPSMVANDRWGKAAHFVMIM